ncbi:hypothetical protein F5Y12DRAFT_781319 [Xylaria sp. FL1777]|nr:hypothetical protein F5Y12DRAFT_781319 [Xylaria sp. FL1777]
MDDSSKPVASAITSPLVVVSAIFPVLSAVSIFLRFYARRISRQTYHADDAWVVVAWVSALVLSILVWTFTALSGINYYSVDVVTGTQYSLELIWLSSVLNQVPLATVKISILLFYSRIFPGRKFRTCVWIAITTVTLWAIIFVILVITQVDPVSQSFKLPGGRLIYNAAALGLAQVGTSIALDILVLLFPVPMIYRLKMAPWKKLSVALIFWLGAFCVVAATTRLVLLDQSIQAVLESRGNVAVQSKQFIFLILEPNCSIIAACLPCYGPLLKTGRGPESLVRSVRSMFSLQSRSSSKHSFSAASNAKHMNSATAAESQVELRPQEWPGKPQRDVHCVGGNLDSPTSGPQERVSSGIYVTNGVTVQRE